MARKSSTSAAETKDAKGDAPILDTNNSAIKTLIKKGKERGYVTHDELNNALPQDELTSEQIEDVMSALSEMGVNVIDAQIVMMLLKLPHQKKAQHQAIYQIVMCLAQMTLCVCICAKWALLSCCLVRVRSRLPSVLKLAEK